MSHADSSHFHFVFVLRSPVRDGTLRSVPKRLLYHCILLCMCLSQRDSDRRTVSIETTISCRDISICPHVAHFVVCMFSPVYHLFKRGDHCRVTSTERVIYVVVLRGLVSRKGLPRAIFIVLSKLS